METNNIDSLRFDVDGKAYFLHHSKADLKVGETIKTTGAFPQSTAGDALYGYSYGWDAMNPGSIANAIHNQPKARNIYITSANAEEVFPDLNVIQSNARAIAGEQTILDKISINPNETFEEAHSRVIESLNKLNIPMRTKEEERLANLEIAISERGQKAAAQYSLASAETRLREISKSIDGYDIPDNLDELIEIADENGSYMRTVNGNLEIGEVKGAIRARAYKEGGLEGLRAQIIKEEGSFEAFGRRPEVLGEIKELTDKAGEVAGNKLGTMSKRTLSELIRSSETAAAVMKSAKMAIDFI